MGWADLLQTDDETIVLPWVGGRSVQFRYRKWTLDGDLPREHGWFKFKISGRRCSVTEGHEADPDKLTCRVTGYLVGDRIVDDKSHIDPDPKRSLLFSEQVHLIEDGLDRFVRVVAGRVDVGGPLIFMRVEMPLGVEDQVTEALYERRASLRGIKGVTPALDAAFRLETFHRAEVERRRAELERLRQEEERKRALDERRQQLMQQTGSADSRRRLAQVDFGEGARAALRIGNAEYLDHRNGRTRGEMVVQFRVDGRRFECVCDATTLRIIDSGICLTDHVSGEKGDTRFTLESLPGVIRQAMRERVPHVYRHVDDDYDGDDD